MNQHLQNLISLLQEMEAAISDITVILDQHSKASKARALAVVKSSQYEASMIERTMLDQDDE